MIECPMCGENYIRVAEEYCYQCDMLAIFDDYEHDFVLS